MSRNLGDILCYFCQNDTVKLTGSERSITKQDCHAYFNEYEGMIVADAECKRCKARYLAWVDGSKRTLGSNHPMSDYPNRSQIPSNYKFTDLSFSSSFNDEPGVCDLPIFDSEGYPWSPDGEHYFHNNCLITCLLCNVEPKVFYAINYSSGVGLKYVSFCGYHKHRARTDNPLWVEVNKNELLTQKLLEV